MMARIYQKSSPTATSFLQKKSLPFTHHHITEIDDDVAINFSRQNSARLAKLQDRDALWNAVFYSLPQVSLGVHGLGKGYFAGGGRALWYILDLARA